MRTFKWILRYIFFALLLCGAILFSFYCFSVSSKISQSINDISFIDTASKSVTEAGALIQRRDTFTSLGFFGVIAGGVIVVIIVLLGIYNHNEKKIVAFFVRGSKDGNDKKAKSKTEKVPRSKKSTTGRSFTPVLPSDRRGTQANSVPVTPPVTPVTPVSNAAVTPTVNVPASSEPSIPVTPVQNQSAAPTAAVNSNPVAGSSVVTNKVTFCGQCGHRHEGNVSFCARCGAKIKKNTD